MQLLHLTVYQQVLLIHRSTGKPRLFCLSSEVLSSKLAVVQQLCSFSFLQAVYMVHFSSAGLQVFSSADTVSLHDGGPSFTWIPTVSGCLIQRQLGYRRGCQPNGNFTTDIELLGDSNVGKSRNLGVDGHAIMRITD